MKLNKPAQILIGLFFLLLIGTCVSFNSQVNRSRNALSVEIAKTQFALSKFDNDNAPFDSVNTKNDTVLFYKNNVFVGKSVIQSK